MKFDLDSAAWTTAHDFVLVFLSLTHGTDADLTAEERRTTLDHLRKWFPERSGDLGGITEDAMRLYMGPNRNAMVQTSVESLRQALTPEERIGLLNDLAELAHADGQVIPGEVAFIQQFARYLGVG
jgi:uncharacterized tellurite resistance protein B-like protein